MLGIQDMTLIKVLVAVAEMAQSLLKFLLETGIFAIEVVKFKLQSQSGFQMSILLCKGQDKN